MWLQTTSAQYRRICLDTVGVVPLCLMGLYLANRVCYDFRMCPDPRLGAKIPILRVPLLSGEWPLLFHEVLAALP